MNLQRIKLTLLLVSLGELVNKIIPLLLIRLGQDRLGLHALGEAQFGIYIVELFLPVMTWGFELYGPISLRGIDKGSQDWKERIGQIVGTRMLLGALVYGALLLSLFTVDKFLPYRSMAIPIGLLMFLSSVSTTFVHTADQSLGPLARISIVAKIVSFIAIFLLVQNPDQSLLFALLSYGVNVAIALGSVIFILRKYGVIFPRFDRIFPTFKLSFPFAITYILAMLVERVELWFAETWGGAVAVGGLSGPLRLYQGLLFVIIALSSILYSEGLAFPEKVGRFLRFTVWLLAAFILPLMVGVFFVGEPLLVMVGGEGFVGQGFNLALICSGMLGHSLLLVAGVQALSAIGKIKWTNAAYFFALLIGVIGSEVLMRYHQPNYALLAPALGKTLAGIALFYLACRETSGFTNFKLPLSGIAVGLVAMFAFLWESGEIFWFWRLILAAGIYCLIFAAFSQRVLLKLIKRDFA
jgi:O-antigen/teichoic acid export membrane protein